MSVMFNSMSVWAAGNDSENGFEVALCCIVRDLKRIGT